MPGYLNTKNIVADLKKKKKINKHREKTINITQVNSDFKYKTTKRTITDIHQIWTFYLHFKLLHSCFSHLSNGKLKDSLQNSEVDQSLQRSLPCMCLTHQKDDRKCNWNAYITTMMLENISQFIPILWFCHSVLLFYILCLFLLCQCLCIHRILTLGTIKCRGGKKERM